MKNLPHFLGIGAQKCATSWLWVNLRHHPEIWMPPVKELHFFDHLYAEANRRWTTKHIEKAVLQSLKWHANHDELNDLRFFRYMSDLATEELFTEAWYERAFDRPAAKGKVLGDITPEYCTIPDEGVKYVRSYLGQDLKIIMLIRDPIDRALSQVRMNASRRGIKLSPTEPKGWNRIVSEPSILNRGDYRHSVSTWEDHFPAENILYLPYGRVREEPNELMAEVGEFLGLRPFEYEGLKNVVHKTNLQIAPPEEVTETLSHKLNDQVEFLTNRFGSEFVELSR